jgi:hypothetical protein
VGETTLLLSIGLEGNDNGLFSARKTVECIYMSNSTTNALPYKPLAPLIRQWYVQCDISQIILRELLATILHDSTLEMCTRVTVKKVSVYARTLSNLE